MGKPIKVRREIVKYNGQLVEAEQDVIATEFPMTIMLNGEEFATLVCSPDSLEELVIGFLASEGIIRIPDKDIKSLSIDDSKGFAYIELQFKVDLGKQLHSKRFIGSCCGKSRQSFYYINDVRTAKTSNTNTTITPQKCIELMEKLQDGSDLFKQTGGVHNAALCHEHDIILSRSDIGRHNALDKIYGYSLMNKLPIHDKLLVFSGRVSSEILIKAAKIGVGLILSKSAPTELAIQTATDLQITIVGFIRNGSFNIYTHPYRIVQTTD